MNSFTLHAFLRNIKSVNTEQDQSNILKVQLRMNVPAFTFDQELVFGWVKSGTLQRWKWYFLIEQHILAH